MLHVELSSESSGERERVFSICERNAIALSGSQKLTLEAYVESLTNWNTRINLVSRIDISKVWSRHILHSICPLMKLTLPVGSAVLDIGSGGGLPGIALAIVREDLKVILVDSVRKKTEALEQIIAEVGIGNASVIHSRIEEPAFVSVHRNRFDFAVARAVTHLSKLIVWSKPLLRPRLQEPSYTFPPTNETRRIVPPALLVYKGGNLTRELPRQTPEKTRIEVMDLGFVGSEESGLEEKKLVIVQYEE